MGVSPYFSLKPMSLLGPVLFQRHLEARAEVTCSGLHSLNGRQGRAGLQEAKQSGGGCRTRTVLVTVSLLPGCDSGTVFLVLAGPSPAKATASAAALPPEVLYFQRCLASKRCFLSKGSLAACRCGLKVPVPVPPAPLPPGDLQ